MLSSTHRPRGPQSWLISENSNTPPLPRLSNSTSDSHTHKAAHTPSRKGPNSRGKTQGRSDFSGVLVRGAHIQGRQKLGGELASPTSHRTMQVMGHHGAGPPLSRGVRPLVQGSPMEDVSAEQALSVTEKPVTALAIKGRGTTQTRSIHTAEDPHTTQRGTSVGQGTIPVGVKHTPGAKPL